MRTCSWRCMREAKADGGHAVGMHCKPTLANRKATRQVTGQDACTTTDGRTPVAWVQNDVAGFGANVKAGVSCGTAATVPMPLDDACGSWGLVLEYRFSA